jgi:ABC-type branched-subunit amino acid transport system ATPase component
MIIEYHLNPLRRLTVLRVEKVVKSFGGVRAVDGCSLTVEEGSITGLIGPNGAGKTTLFDIITGFQRPDAGEIYFDGRRIHGLMPHQISRRALCRTFQIVRELKEMTVLENLMLVPGGQRGEHIWYSWFHPRQVRTQEAEIERRALEVLEFVELSHLSGEYAKNLSGGQKKLLELARTLMAEPRMILLDEPGAGVNPTLMNKLTSKIVSLRSQGKTFLLIEHDIDLVTELCDTVIVMDKGRSLTQGTPQEIKEDPRVLEAYLGGRP